jgi:hypothetical protein
MKTDIEQIGVPLTHSAFRAAVNAQLTSTEANVDDLYAYQLGWDDLTETLTGKNLNTTAGKANYDFTNGWVRLEAAGSIDVDADVVNATFQTRHRMETGQLLRFHLHWVQSTSTSRTLTGKYRVIQNGATIGSWTSFSATCSYGGEGDNIFDYSSGSIGQITELFELDTTDWGLSTLVQVRLTRSDSNANGDVYALYLDAHYKTDRPSGSYEEYAKWQGD